MTWPLECHGGLCLAFSGKKSSFVVLFEKYTDTDNFHEESGGLEWEQGQFLPKLNTYSYNLLPFIFIH